MSQTLHCAQGHEWTPSVGSASAADSRAMCPVCGAVAETLMLPVAKAGAVRSLALPTASSAASNVPSFDARSTDGARDDATLTSAPPLPRRSFAMPAEPSPSIAGYEMLGELGRGGMGMVYKARQTSLDRIVAIKLLTAGSRQRFRTEAEAIAHVQHPNIVQIFEVGEAQGRPYLSQEYIAAGSLSDQLDGTPWSGQAAARLVAKLAAAMHFSHERDIVHRDLKPANVLMADTETPKISDFGLAKKLDDDSGETATGDIMGSPSYMAPEQASGATRQIGPAADIYSLGAILYELLTGRPPFRGETPMDTVYQAISIEAVSPRRLQPKVPRDLETICLKCLEKSPDHRYATAQELADELQRFLAGDPIHARPVGVWTRAAKWARRRPGAAAAIGIGALAATVISVGGTYYNFHLNAALRTARIEEQRRTATLGQAQEMVDRLVSEYSEGELASLPHSESARRKLLDAALAFCRDMQAENPEQPQLRWQIGRAQRQAADLQTLLGERNDAETSYAAAIDVLQKLVAEHPQPRYQRELAGAQLNRANLLASSGRRAEADRSYREATAGFQRLATADSANADLQQQVARALDSQGANLVANGSSAEAVEALRNALAIRETLLAKSPTATDARQSLATSYNNLGTLYQQKNDAAEAERWFAKALELYKSLHEGSPRVAEFRTGLAAASANVALARGVAKNFDAAEQAFQQSLAVLSQLTADFPAVVEYRDQQAQTAINFGLLLEQLGKLEGAKEQHELARRLYAVLLKQDAVPSYRQGLATSLHRLGILASAEKRFSDADDLLSESIDLQNVLVSQAPQNADYLNQRSLAYRSAGELLLAQNDAVKARYYLNLAAENENLAVELWPERSDLKRQLWRHYALLASAELELGEIERAAQLADKIADLAADDGESLCEAATLLARCIPLVDRFKASVSPNFGEQCGAKAVQLLRQAAQKGDPNIAATLESATSQPLRDRGDFQSLVKEVAKKDVESRKPMSDESKQ